MPSIIAPPVASPDSSQSLRRISWSAVVAGVVIASALQLLLNLLGLAIGLWNLEVESPRSIGLAAGAWWLASALVSLHAGGWAAGHLAGSPRRFDGAMHGVLVWGLGSLAMVWLVSTAAGALLGGATSVLSRTAGQTGELLQEIAPDAAQVAQTAASAAGLPAAELATQLGKSLTGPRAAETTRELQELLTGALRRDVESPEFRRELSTFLTERGGIDADEAREMTDTAIARLSEARAGLAATGNRIETTTESAARTGGSAAFWAFLALLAGGVAAALGGRAGSPRHVATLEVLPSAP